MKYIGLTTAAALLMVATPAYSADWVHVITDRDGSVWYYDSESIRRSGDQVIIWEKSDHSQDRRTKYRETKARTRYDCIDGTQTIISFIRHLPNGESVSWDLPIYEQKATTIFPDTTAEAVLKAVCRATAR